MITLYFYNIHVVKIYKWEKLLKQIVKIMLKDTQVFSLAKQYSKHKIKW